jgi:basic amino acid/polyamine antiporter, APA family
VNRPQISQASATALALLFVWLAPLRELLTYIGWTLSLSAAATVLGLVRLRWREGHDRVPVPAWPLPPLLFMTAVLAFALFSLWQAPLGGLLGLGTLLLATLLAHLAHRRQGKLADRA